MLLASGNDALSEVMVLSNPEHFSRSKRVIKSVGVFHAAQFGLILEDLVKRKIQNKVTIFAVFCQSVTDF